MRSIDSKLLKIILYFKLDDVNTQQYRINTKARQEHNDLAQGQESDRGGAKGIAKESSTLIGPKGRRLGLEWLEMLARFQQRRESQQINKRATVVYGALKAGIINRAKEKSLSHGG